MADVIISCDDHMDLSTLPRDLFEKRLPAKFRESGPRVVQGPDSLVWQAEGKVLGFSGQRPASAVQYATVRAGRDDDGFRPSTPKLRLEDMDFDGVRTQVIYGPPMGFPLADLDLKAAVLGAYNDWAAEFNEHDPDRLCVLAMLPVHDAATATVELRRAREQGHRGALFNTFQCVEPIYSERWDPLWSAAEALDMPISLHLGGGMHMLKSNPGTWLTPAVATVSPMQLDESLASLIFSGMFERHPQFKLILAESGIGWLPYFLERMDLEYRKHVLGGSVRSHSLKREPSQTFHDQVFATFEEDRFGVQMIPHIGEDNVMWASDYPHPDSTFPHSRQEIEEAFAGLPESAKIKATRDTCASLYSFRI